MTFNTLHFAAFFFIVYILYLALRNDFRWQNRLLLAASFIFYSFWDWRFLSLIMLSAAMNYYLSAEIDKSERDDERKRLLAINIFLNLAILGCFKYFNFFTDSLMSLLWVCGIRLDRFFLDVVMPLGISFYTFQAMSYPIDIYRRAIKPMGSLADFTLFVSFFPLVISGPIERARNILPQILAKREVTADKVYSGAWLIFWGLYKKIVIADNLAKLTKVIFNDPSSYPGGAVLIAAYLFAFQIYADFSGYSDMARGISRLMGFEVMANFKVPFFSSSINELWQRWHISLTTWIKEYLFYPLALAKFKGRQLSAQVVMIVTWTIMGFWHGPESRFVYWGLYHGIILVIYNKLRPYIIQVKPSGAILSAAWIMVQTFIVFNLFCLGILFFAAATAQDAFTAFRTILSGISSAPAYVYAFKTQIIMLVCPLVAVEYFQFRTSDEMAVLRWPAPVKAAVYYVILYSIIMYGVFSVQKYYYFQF